MVGRIWNLKNHQKHRVLPASSKQVVKNPFQAFAEVMGEEPKQLPTTRKKSWVEMMEEEEAEYTEDEKYAMIVHQSAILARYR